MWTFRIYSLSNFQIYYTAVLTTVVLLYVTSSVLIPVSLYLLTTFMNYFPHPSPPASGNHKSDHFLSKFVFLRFYNIVIYNKKYIFAIWSLTLFLASSS